MVLTPIAEGFIKLGVDTLHKDENCIMLALSTTTNTRPAT